MIRSKIYYIRILLGFIVGAICGLLKIGGNPLGWIGIFIGAAAYILSYRLIALALALGSYPPEQRRPMYTVGIGAYILTWIITWVIIYTYMESASYLHEWLLTFS